MAIKRGETRDDNRSFVESMLKKSEEKNTTKPRSLYDSVDIEKVQQLTAEIKSGSTAYRGRK